MNKNTLIAVTVAIVLTLGGGTTYVVVHSRNNQKAAERDALMMAEEKAKMKAKEEAKMKEDEAMKKTDASKMSDTDNMSKDNMVQ